MKNKKTKKTVAIRFLGVLILKKITEYEYPVNHELDDENFKEKLFSSVRNVTNI